MSQTPAKDAELQRLVALAMRAAIYPMDPGAFNRGRAKLIERSMGLSMPRFAISRTATMLPRLMWAMAAVAVAIGLVWGLRARPVTFVVHELPAAASYVRALDDHPVDVEFTDGTRVSAEAGARFRILDRSSHGAKILIERGRSTARVVHKRGADWRFVAGPFEVQVTGTRFWIDWDPAAEELNLSLEDGSVEVTGPLSPARVSMRAGQRLQASLAQRSLTVFDSATPPTPVASAIGMAQKQEPTVAKSYIDSAPSSSAVVASTNAGAAPPQSPAWSKLLAKGQFESIVQLAESPSRPNCAETCNASDLRILAEAARYAGRADLAETTLLALRKRFASHSESAKAAFLLARLYESRADRARAEVFYRTYLEESPSSELAADALAGQMRVVRRSRGAKAAEPLARQYLRRYPEGVHAAAAQQILREEP